MSTDQPQQPGPGQAPPPQPVTPAYSAAPRPEAPPAEYSTYAAAPTNPAPAAGSSSHVGVIIASIVGGLLLLGLTFGGGAVVGWVIGSHHAGREASQVQNWQGPGQPGRYHDGQGGHGRGDGDRRGQPRPGLPGQEVPTPAPAP